MIQEIITLVVDNLPTQYYINFEKERKKFHFQPTLKNKSAPTFIVLVENKEFRTKDLSDQKIGIQAIEKVKEIIANEIFDNF